VHHLIEGPDELGVTVTDKEAERATPVLELGNQVPGLLGDPGPGRVGRHHGEEHHATLDGNEEEYINATEHDRIDVKEPVST